MACGIVLRIAVKFCTAPRTLPGRLIISVRPRIPQTARESGASGVESRLSKPHQLRQPRSLALDDSSCSFRRVVARGKARPACRADEVHIAAVCILPEPRGISRGHPENLSGGNAAAELFQVRRLTAGPDLSSRSPRAAESDSNDCCNFDSRHDLIVLQPDQQFANRRHWTPRRLQSSCSRRQVRTIRAAMVDTQTAC